MLEVYFTATKSELKCRNLIILIPRLFKNRFLRVVCNSQYNSRQAYTSLRRYTVATLHTSNMAAVAIVDRMTSQSPHVILNLPNSKRY